MTSQVAGDARAGDAANLCCDLLYRYHQRKAEDKSPRQTITEFGADLAVRADAARIVISCARNEARPESPYKGANSSRRFGIR